MTNLSVTSRTLANEYAQFSCLLCTISERYLYAGRLNDAIRVLAQGAQIIDDNSDVPQVAQARLLIQKGKILNWITLMGDNHLAQAELTLKRAKQIAESIEDNNLQGYANLYLGNLLDFRKLLMGQDDWGESLEMVQHAYELFLTTNDKKGQGTALFFIGLIYQRLPQLDKASIHFAQALDLARQNEDKFEESEAIRHLGFLAFLAGDLDEAYQHAQESLRLREAIDCRMGLSSAHHVVGIAQESRGELLAAMVSYKKAAEIAEELSLDVPHIQALLALSSLNEKQAHLDKALACAEQANRIAEATRYPTFIHAAAIRLEEISS